MRTAIELPRRDSAASLDDGVLVLDGFIEEDPGVVDVLSDADDLDVAVHACLQIGARAAKAAHASLDGLVVEQAFSKLSERFDGAVEDATKRIQGTANGLLGPEGGALPTMLDEMKTQLGQQFGALFDEDSKTSAVAVLEKVFAATCDRYGRDMRKALDPSDADSPLGRWKGEVLTVVREQVGLVLTQVGEMASGIAATEAKAEVFQITSAKGFTFEDQVHVALSAVATRYGDLAEHVGRTPGEAGALTGDEVVCLNTDDTGGRQVQLTFESKTKKMSLRKVLEELDDAMKNRGADAAVAVFSSVDKAPTAVPFHFYGNRAVVVYDPGSVDDRSLELAYMWAPWEARKHLAEPTDTLDFARAEAAINSVKLALGRMTTVRRHHATAKKSIDAAGDEVSALVSDVDAAMIELEWVLG